MTNTPTKIVYTARASVTGGRTGRARAESGRLDLQLDRPQEQGGKGEGTNPEELFALGYGACFQGALGAVAGKQGIDTSASELDIAVGFGPESNSFGLTVDITVTIPGVDDETAQRLAEETHQFCPYSKATRGNIPVTVTGKAA
jgi:lipoyl-dependent peroxiredoxin